jgi:hypothetical protein
VQGALSPQALKRAEIRAINETCAWMRGKLLQMLPAATGIPRKILTRRIRHNKAKATVNSGVSGKVWFGIKPIDAIYLKDEGPIATGYMAGGFFFEGGFKAQMESGHIGIFARDIARGKYDAPYAWKTKAGARKVGTRRTEHIKTQSVKIDAMANECARRLIAPAQLALTEKMTRLVNWELEQACR